MNKIAHISKKKKILFIIRLYRQIPNITLMFKNQLQFKTIISQFKNSLLMQSKNI